MKRIAFCLLLNIFISLSFYTSKALSSQDHFKKVIWVVLENTDYSSAMTQPEFVALTKKGLLFTNFSGEAHPSQPNYIAMIAGDSLGVANDNPVNINSRHLGDLLEAANMDWRVYAEDFPGNCFNGATQGNYARKHNPFISFTNVSRDSQRCKKIVDASAFDRDLAADQLPEYSMYIPNLRDDGHNTGSDFSSKWFASKFASLINSADGLQDTLLVVTFDESENRRSNKIFTVILGGSVRAGITNNQTLNHISLLKLIEDEWGLGNLGRADATAPVIDGIWNH